MYLRNTSRYPTDEVRELVKFAVSKVDMRRVCVNVKNALRASHAGYAYYGVPVVSNAPPSTEHLVTLRVGPETLFPADGHDHRYFKENGRWPRYELRDWREALVAIAAHEAKHIEQYREGLPHSEVRCEHFAAGMVKTYQKQRAAPEGAAQTLAS